MATSRPRTRQGIVGRTNTQGSSTPSLPVLQLRPKSSMDTHDTTSQRSGPRLRPYEEQPINRTNRSKSSVGFTRTEEVDEARRIFKEQFARKFKRSTDAFRDVDREGKGQISSDGIDTTLRSLMHQPPRHVADNLYDQINTGRDGVEINQFVKHLWPDTSAPPTFPNDGQNMSMTLHGTTDTVGSLNDTRGSSKSRYLFSPGTKQGFFSETNCDSVTGLMNSTMSGPGNTSSVAYDILSMHKMRDRGARMPSERSKRRDKRLEAAATRAPRASTAVHYNIISAKTPRSWGEERHIELATRACVFTRVHNTQGMPPNSRLWGNPRITF